MRIRVAGPSDAVRMVEIERTIAPTPWSLAQFLASCRGANERCWVACGDAGDVTGFAISQQVLDEATLLNLGVAEPCQRRGLGALLLAEVLGQAAGEGAQRCLLEVRASNTAAQRLYTGSGFVRDGVRKGYYPTPGGKEDAILMSLDMNLWN